MNKNNKTPIILHGHFYQPPRENPVTGIIPKQLSAEPFVDWNERILNSCYAANINARYLDGTGQVISITNNFEHISFNFGPTLLSWMEEHHKDIHDQIIDADKKSVKHLGHGNALAQAFNHTILPLDSLDDARIQIRWGIQDFQSRFDRMPEGMWLPETAINPNVIDLLSDEGIKFVILSPWQCKSVEDEEGNTVNLNGKPAPYDRAYILTGTNGGTINAFFYHPHLAENISFGHLLRDADAFYSHFEHLKNNEKPKLIHTATDGEIYGHHEPFGDMALAAVIKKVETRDDFEFTNYGKFLAENPATLHATLHKGEADKGTSWSCFHGVSRWYKDCGCSTGGPEKWNQKWRTPLRNALDNNSERLTKIFNSRINTIFQNQVEPYQLLTNYGIVASQRKTMIDFIKALIEQYPVAKGNESEIACLLDGMKNKFFSFTSCGWFFNDLAGIEPKQNLQYALYAINLFQRYSTTSLLAPFLKDLQLAKSNDVKEGNGLNIAQTILKLIPGEVEAAIYFVMNRAIANDKFYTSHYGRYELKSIESIKENPKLDIYNTISLRSFSFEGLYDLDDEGENLNISMTVKDIPDNNVRHYSLTNTDINPRILESAFYWIEYSLSFVDDESIRQISKDVRNYSFIFNSSPYLPIDKNSVEFIGTALRALRSLFITPDTLSWDEMEPSVYSLVSFIQNHGRINEIIKLKKIFIEETEDLTTKILDEGLTNSRMIELSQFLKFTYKVKLIIDLGNLQNAIYPYFDDKESRKNLDMKKFLKMKSLLNFV
jgi:hypothetical protein